MCAPVAISGQEALTNLAPVNNRPQASELIPDAPLPSDPTMSPLPSPLPSIDTQMDRAAAQAPPVVATPQEQTAPQGGSSSQSPRPQQTEQDPPIQPSEREKARAQIKEQERQRVLGIVPLFNTTYRSDAVSLTAKEKMGLAFRSAIDPVTFGTAFFVAGFSEAFGDNAGFGWGPEGYFKRTGAAYLDSFSGTMIGNGILPSLLHQDPRYFRLGKGSTTHRLLYAAATTVICKHDVSRKWEPNYSNVGGNIIAGLISTTYYPASNSDIEQAMTNSLVVTAEGAIGSIFQEFWPDISRKLFHRDPTHGLDAQAK